jgi:hypothetical protein
MSEMNLDLAMAPGSAAKIMAKGMQEGWSCADKAGQRHTVARYLPARSAASVAQFTSARRDERCVLGHRHQYRRLSPVRCGRPGAMTPYNNRAKSLVRMRMRPNCYTDQEQGWLINWGYALTDAAFRSRVLGPGFPAGSWPIPEYKLS